MGKKKYVDPDAQYFRFLGRLRNGGRSNMYGAIPYLVEAFRMDREMAFRLVCRWVDAQEARAREAPQGDGAPRRPTGDGRGATMPRPAEQMTMLFAPGAAPAGAGSRAPLARERRVAPPKRSPTKRSPPKSPPPKRPLPAGPPAKVASKPASRPASKAAPKAAPKRSAKTASKPAAGKPAKLTKAAKVAKVAKDAKAA